MAKSKSRYGTGGAKNGGNDGGNGMAASNVRGKGARAKAAFIAAKAKRSQVSLPPAGGK